LSKQFFSFGLKNCPEEEKEIQEYRTKNCKDEEIAHRVHAILIELVVQTNNVVEEQQSD
jgi:hypothetical protein